MNRTEYKQAARNCEFAYLVVNVGGVFRHVRIFKKEAIRLGRNGWKEPTIAAYTEHNGRDLYIECHRRL